MHIKPVLIIFCSRSTDVISAIDSSLVVLLDIVKRTKRSCALLFGENETVLKSFASMSERSLPHIFMHTVHNGRRYITAYAFFQFVAIFSHFSSHENKSYFPSAQHYKSRPSRMCVETWNQYFRVWRMQSFRRCYKIVFCNLFISLNVAPLLQDCRPLHRHIIFFAFLDLPICGGTVHES